MHLIVGLGNPGAKYAGYRHNVGFMAVDAIAKHHNFAPYKSKFNGLVSDGTVQGHRTLLLKPQTWMNRSGECIQAAANFYKLPAEAITVIYDEIDLKPGKVRVKSGGGNGGHNGLRSIDPQIGTAYQRVRVGVGHPGHKDLVSRHVLSNFHKIDHEWLDPLLEAIAQNADLLVKLDAANFMNKMAMALAKADEEILAQQDKTASSRPAPKPTPKTDAETENQGPLSAVLKKLFNRE